ncbi:cyclic nucleotide-binding domain-containing protein [Tenggerimyces flavus]|uniref:Cyclic nucleotide-binding domain-containing protein n=1 Tax=Tenggerimyces flavus TaxID=1708749 RepID=A0ABV7YJI2_9ACTN|nr:cyclic nucleotide-binding domain-containing protein [Tenggerimyces flavus]MBM7787702.1 CRP-like cAMP-binding protein [Tenggerimyces flavus]
MADKKVVEQLGQVPLLADLSRWDLGRIASQGREVQHPPGHEVTEEGGRAVGFHLVLDGGAEVEIGGESRAALKAGDYFGEISLIDGKPRTATVRAGADGMRTFALQAGEFSAILDKHPELARPLLLTLCGRLREAEERGRERH